MAFHGPVAVYSAAKAALITEEFRVEKGTLFSHHPIQSDDPDDGVDRIIKSMITCWNWMKVQSSLRHPRPRNSTDVITAWSQKWPVSAVTVFHFLASSSLQKLCFLGEQLLYHFNVAINQYRPASINPQYPFKHFLTALPSSTLKDAPRTTIKKRDKHLACHQLSLS